MIMLTDIQISTLETVSETFGGIVELQMACSQYRREIALITADLWKIDFAAVQRINPIAYSKVIASLPTEKANELIAFVAQYKGQPLPEVQRASTLSEAKAIAAAKGGGTIVKP